MTLAGRHVLLGVSGGIASYKACTVARRLAESGAAVDVVLTLSAAEFVRPLTFEALTGRPVLTSLWERGRALAHIALAKEPDLLVVAPATANLLARTALGIADDLLTAILLAATRPVLVAPAMNDDMWAHPATRQNVARLRDRGWQFVGPEIGALAEGPSDRPGRMSEPEDILREIERLLGGATSPLRARRVLVTAGPTREALDPVRVITNRSSGRMGFALARAAYARGAEVVLVTGPTALEPPGGVRVLRVDDTAALAEAVGAHLPDADVLIMAAAPADFRPARAEPQKRPRETGLPQLTLEPTPDVLRETRDRRKPGAIVVGFAYETDAGEAKARAKLEQKDLDLVVLNHAGANTGAEVTTNQVTLVTRDGAERGPLETKDAAAERILDVVERLL